MSTGEEQDHSEVTGRFFPFVAAGRRVVVLDSATQIPQHLASIQLEPRSEVIVNCSYAGVYCARLIKDVQPLGTVGVDCGIGKDGAGISGLWYFEALGVPAAAAGIADVELGNGQDLWQNGRISRVNAVATALGIEPGVSVRQAARLMIDAPAEIPEADLFNRRVVYEGRFGHDVVATNSIADALPEDRDANVLCTAGHTGKSVIGYIVGFRPYGFICSDGGVGKNGSGLVALDPANLAGIPGAAVSADSARMGDGLSTYEDGVISAANELAIIAGIRLGMAAREAARLMADRSGG